MVTTTRRIATMLNLERLLVNNESDDDVDKMTILQEYAILVKDTKYAAFIHEDVKYGYNPMSPAYVKIEDLIKDLKDTKKHFFFKIQDVVNNNKVIGIVHTCYMKEEEEEEEEKEEHNNVLKDISLSTTMYIDTIAIHPDSQGKGYGSNIMKKLEVEFSHVKLFVLITQADNLRNIHFYEKLGYIATGENDIQANDKLLLIEFKKSIK